MYSVLILFKSAFSLSKFTRGYSIKNPAYSIFHDSTCKYFYVIFKNVTVYDTIASLKETSGKIFLISKPNKF